MNPAAFDDLSRALGGARSRRGVLRVLAGGLAGAVATSLGLTRVRVASAWDFSRACTDPANCVPVAGDPAAWGRCAGRCEQARAECRLRCVRTCSALPPLQRAGCITTRCIGMNPTCAGLGGPAAQTGLTVRNGTAAAVMVYLTLSPVDGCLRSVTVEEVPFVITRVDANQGWFMLPPGAAVSYTAAPGACMSGNLSFGGPPLNCPDRTQFPNGMNLAEFTLNNGAQGSGTQETVDISAVYGVNARLRFQLSGGGAWNAGATQPSVTQFENRALLQNIGLPGVFPYGCDDCTRRTSPTVPCTGPNVPPFPDTCDVIRVCNVQRDASVAGGTVEIVFAGFL